jgi:hypothetical protein
LTIEKGAATLVAHLHSSNNPKAYIMKFGKYSHREFRWAFTLVAYLEISGPEAGPSRPVATQGQISLQICAGAKFVRASTVGRGSTHPESSTDSILDAQHYKLDT